MEGWVTVTVVAVVTIALLVAFRNKWVRKTVFRRGDTEMTFDAGEQMPGRFTSRNSEFEDSEVKSSGATTEFHDSRSKNSKFSIN